MIAWALNIGMAQAQNVGIGTSSPAASAKLEITDASRGLLIPRVALLSTSNGTAPVATPANSLLVYNTATISDVTPGYYYWNGTAWKRLLNGDNAWSLDGNTASTTNFIGTTNPIALRFITGNIERGRINGSTGEVVFGATVSPYSGNLVSGVSTASLPFAVNGFSANVGSGVWGEIVTGNSTAYSAIQGNYQGSGTGAAVLGNYSGTNVSLTRTGVSGICSNPTTAAGGIGVYGLNNISSGSSRVGVLGTYNSSAFGLGVVGLADGGAIMSGNVDVGVSGWCTNNTNYSGYFNGNHVIANGTKSASVGTSKGNQLLYCMESPEVWFEDFGTAQLVNGKVEVQLDPLFLETVLIDEQHPMMVFLQEQGNCNGLYVEPGTTSFTVYEKQGGTSNVKFTYRLVAKRWSFPDHRFGNDPVWGPGDTRQYMDQSPARAVDYNQAVQKDLEDKQNRTPAKLPSTIVYPESPKFETERPARSRTAPGQE
jgi:hypothetical protein